MASPKSPNSLSRAPAPSSTKSPPASRRRGVVAFDAPATRSAVRANAATLSRVVSRSARSESTTGSTARMDDGGMDGASSIVNRRAAVRISSRSSKDASTGSGSGDGGVRPPSRPSPSAPSRVPPRSSRGESSCRRRALADDDEDDRGARECVSRDDANRGATGSRRAGEYGGEDVPSLGSRDDVHGVLAAGVRRLGVGAARADEPRHHGPVLVPRGDVQRCVAARVPGARGDARVLVGVLEDEANGREVSARRRREQRGERRGSLLRRGGASRPPGLTTRRSTRRCRKENSTAARANEARTTLARRRLSLAPRDECDAERSRAVSCSRETTTRTSEPTKRRETHNDAIHIPAHCGARFARGRFRYSKSDAPQAQ